jgi:hypothetical protein
LLLTKSESEVEEVDDLTTTNPAVLKQLIDVDDPFAAHLCDNPLTAVGIEGADEYSQNE